MAPHPDGFSLALFQKGWGLLKNDILKLVDEFQDGEFLDCKLNTTFIALIPKKGRDGLGGFRPINLLGSMYKILAKILARGKVMN